MWNKYGQLILAVAYTLVVLCVAFIKPDAFYIPLEVWDNVASAGWAMVPVMLAYLLLRGGQYLKAKADEAEAVMWSVRHGTKRENACFRRNS